MIVGFESAYQKTLRYRNVLFTEAAAATVLTLGVFAGIMNNANQYLVARAAPEAPDFSNGLYLTAANAGTTLGTALCGLFITAAGTRSVLAGALVFLAVGIVLVAVRLRLSDREKTSSRSLTSSELQMIG